MPRRTEAETLSGVVVPSEDPFRCRSSWEIEQSLAVGGLGVWDRQAGGGCEPRLRGPGGKLTGRRCTGADEVDVEDYKGTFTDQRDGIRRLRHFLTNKKQEYYERQKNRYSWRERT